MLESNENNPLENQPIYCIVGQTAAGKTALSIEIAKALGGSRVVEIISADAMQLYRGMDIGTAKIPVVERAGIVHHQLDVLDVWEEASVAKYQEQARLDLMQIQENGKIPVVVGGSGLYVSALLDHLEFPGTDPAVRQELSEMCDRDGLDKLIAELREKDPISAATINLSNPRRVIRALEVVRITGQSYTPVFPRHTSFYPNVHFIGTRVEKAVLHERIYQRAEKMFHDGLLNEAERLLEQGFERGVTARKATGYSQAVSVLKGETTVDEAIAATAFSTRRLAKKQLTWFRRDQRITWYDTAVVTQETFQTIARHVVHGAL